MSLPSVPEIPVLTQPAPPGGVGAALTLAARGRASWSGLLKLSLVAGLVIFLLFFGRRRSSIWNAYLIAAWITTFAVINNVYRILN